MSAGLRRCGPWRQETMRSCASPTGSRPCPIRLASASSTRSAARSSASATSRRSPVGRCRRRRSSFQLPRRLGLVKFRINGKLAYYSLADAWVRDALETALDGDAEGRK